MSKNLQRLGIVVLIFLNIGCDQISKVMVRSRIDDHERIELIDQNFILTKVENSGAFLGMGSTLSPWLKTTLLLVLPALVMIALFAYVLLKKKLTWAEKLGLAFIIGGGVGNIYDRMVYGSVTDFFHIDFVIFRTGIFNMADVSVMIGTGLLLLNAFLFRKKRPSTEELVAEPIQTED